MSGFQISTSEDGNNYTTPAFFSASSTSGRGEREMAQLFNFPQTTARYVQLRILNAIDDSFYVGLGEIRFLNNCMLPPNSGSNQRIENPNFSIPLAVTTQPKEVEIYPNPTINTFFVDMVGNVNSSATIEIVNEIGAVVSYQNIDRITNKPVAIDLENHADGLYLVKIVIDKELPILKKLIKTSR